MRPGGTAAGVAAMLVAVTIWAGWIVLVRATVGAGLSPLDIALMRYGVPALLLAPLWLRRGPAPRGVALWRIAAITLGWGAPFALFAAQGLKAADTALFAALVPGCLPLWVAAILRAGGGPPQPPMGRLGLWLIAGGAALALLPRMAAGEWSVLAGAPWLVAASLAWAAYAVAYRGSGLSPAEATGLVGFWSTVALVPAALVWGQGLTALSPATLAGQVALHGVVSGVASVAAFATGVQALGAARAASFSALVPVLATAGGAVLLGETLTGASAAAIALAAGGVFLVNRAAVRPPPSPP
jgi:drug/metabolite transporter (DMT)-like permease